ncbi:c-type cytochrome [Sorangium sp. So ce1024]|uniref:c-type cytochrome n=1 Tax=Sorangium sp. So ce1024 TaxID=3133327 RepID=UPI003F0FC12A
MTRLRSAASRVRRAASRARSAASGARSAASRAVLALALVLAACAGQAAAPAAPLAVSPVAWPPSAGLGPIRAVADDGRRVVLFHDGAAAVFVDGALDRVERAPHRWVGAAALPAPDGRGAWIVGVDAEGRLLRLPDQGAFEPVSDRYGLDRAPVRAALGLGGGAAAFALDGEIAVADGATVTRYATGPLATLAAGGGRVAFAPGGDGLLALDVATRALRSYPLPGGPAPLLAVTGAGRLLAATPEALYEEDAAGVLRLRLRARAALHGLAVSGDRVWFVDGDELGVLDAAGARWTRGARLPRGARLIGSPTGDVWLLASGAVRRFTAGDHRAGDHVRAEAHVRAGAHGHAAGDGRAGDPGTAAPAWDDIAPIVARACAPCHLPRGEGGVDLSTRAAWTTPSLRESIARRVVEERTMPPPGHALSEADRARIRAFVERARPAGPR